MIGRCKSHRASRRLTLSTISLVPVTFLLAACPGPSTPPPPKIGGYSCLELPTAQDQPGVILRRDPSGQVFAAADLLSGGDRNTVVRTYPSVESADATRTGVEAASLSLVLLEKLLPGITDSMTTESKRDLSSTVKYKDVKELRTYDEPIHTLVREWAGSHKLRPSDHYEIIRDALIASSITVTLSQQQIADFKLDAALSKLVNGQAGITVDRGENYSITSTFNPPQPVCVSAESFAVIMAPAALGGGTPPTATVGDFTPLRGGHPIPQIIHEASPK